MLGAIGIAASAAFYSISTIGPPGLRAPWPCMHGAADSSSGGGGFSAADSSSGGGGFSAARWHRERRRQILEAHPAEVRAITRDYPIHWCNNAQTLTQSHARKCISTWQPC